MTYIPSLDEAGVKPLSISWSRLYEWTQCEMRSNLHMQGKGDTVKDGRRFLHGTLADRAVRKWLEQDEPQLPGQMETYIDEMWEEHAIKSPEYKINWKGDHKEDQDKVRALAKKVVHNVEPFLYERVIPFEYQPEFRFKVPLKLPDSNGLARTVILNGGMDIAVREPDGLVSLYDLKATENENYVKGGIMGQLIFYSIAWSLMFGPPERTRAAFLTPACRVQYHELNITKDERRFLLTRIVNFAQSVWDKIPPACTTDASQCFWCDVKSGCPKFAIPTKTNSKGKHTVSLKDAAAVRDTVIDMYDPRDDREPAPIDGLG